MPEFRSRFLGYHHSNWSIANDDYVGLVDDEGFRVFDRSGEETDALAGLSLQLLRATDGLFVGNTDGKVVAYDPMTSTTLWSEAGWAITGDGDHFYACQGDQENKSTISQLSLSDGKALWSVPAPCDIVVPLEDSVVIVGFDPKVDGGYTLVVVDASTGDERVRRRFEDGTNDQVTGLTGGRRVGEHAVVFGWQANTIVIDGEGTEWVRRVERLGDAVGVVDDLLVTSNPNGLFATEAPTGDVAWSIDADDLGEQFNIGNVTLVDDDLLLVDQGSVALLDARTGERLWTVGVGIAENVSVTAGGDLVYARTPLSLHALDRATGETVWVRALPWSGDVIAANANTDDS